MTSKESSFIYVGIQRAGSEECHITVGETDQT
jgi:hypothetical protein